MSGTRSTVKRPLRLKGAGYLAENQRVWDHWASVGSISSRPIGALSPPEARTMLDPDGWLNWHEIRRVLCLAAGGGQQAPAFAMLGCEVTLLDLSSRQLALDHQVAENLGLSIECIQGDMSDLRFASTATYDLVYHPISTCYVRDVTMVYEEVHRVLRIHGLYRVEHWNPSHMQLWAEKDWGAEGYRLSTSGTPGDAIVTTVSVGPAGGGLLTSQTFPHSLTALIGSLCDTGFALRRLAEDCGGDPTAPAGAEARLAAFVPPFFRILARKVNPHAKGGRPANGAGRARSASAWTTNEG
jgi:SAM-dependent methyltransferase